MSEPLSPEYEAEIRDRVDRLDDNRTFPTATWLASSVNAKSVFPPEQSHVVEDVVQTGSFVARASVGVFGDKQYAEFTAHARDDVPALLDEIDRLRAELGSKAPAEASGGRTGWVRATLIAGGLSVEHADRVMAEVKAEQAAEIDRLRARVAELEALKPARFQDCQMCGAGYEYGQPCQQCEFKKLVAAEHAAAEDASEPCRCGHSKERHAPDVYGAGTCGDCPGDEERSWRHPYTPASKGGA